MRLTAIAAPRDVASTSAAISRPTTKREHDSVPTLGLEEGAPTSNKRFRYTSGR